MSHKTGASSMPAESNEWREESDHRAVSEAAEIQADKGRMKGVGRHHKRQMKKMSLVQRQMLQQGRR